MNNIFQHHPPVITRKSSKVALDNYLQVVLGWWCLGFAALKRLGLHLLLSATIMVIENILLYLSRFSGKYKTVKTQNFVTSVSIKSCLGKTSKELIPANITQITVGVSQADRSNTPIIFIDNVQCQRQWWTRLCKTTYDGWYLQLFVWTLNIIFSI